MLSGGNIWKKDIVTFKANIRIYSPPFFQIQGGIVAKAVGKQELPILNSYLRSHVSAGLMYGPDLPLTATGPWLAANIADPNAISGDKTELDELAIYLKIMSLLMHWMTWRKICLPQVDSRKFTKSFWLPRE